MKKTVLFAAVALLAFAGTTSADIIYTGGTAGTGTDFFDEANWIDNATGMAPAADTINPSPFQIASDLSIGGMFNPVSGVNIRLDNGFTLTLADDATLSTLVISALGGERTNIALRDNAVFTVTQNIARTDFDISGAADLILSTTNNNAEFDTDTLNVSSDWTGSVTVDDRTLQGNSGAGLFNTVTIDGASASNDDFVVVVSGSTSTYSLAAVPEPSSLALLSLGVVGLLARRRK